MTLYRLLEPSVVDGAWLAAGTEIDIDWEPGPHMAPLDEDGRAKLAAFKASRAELEPDYPNAGWPLIERLWHGSLHRERLAARRAEQAERLKEAGGRRK